MGPTIITLLYFSAFIAGTFLLHRFSKAGKSAMPKTMTVLPKVLGGIMCLLTIICLALLISLVKEYSIYLHFFLYLTSLASSILIMIFFMRLNDISQNYSMPSLAGIAGCVASILGTGTDMLLSLFESSSDIALLLSEIASIFATLSPILMIAAAGILCGNVSRFNKTSMTACIIMLASCIIGEVGFDLASFFFEYETSIHIGVFTMWLAPNVGWIILFFMFNIDRQTDTKSYSH